MKSNFAYLLLVLFFVSGCASDNEAKDQVQDIVKHFKKEFAPDKRVAIFDIQVASKKSKLKITGETNLPDIYQQLLDSIKSTEATFEEDIRVLPDAFVGEKKYAVGRNSVINIRSKPKHSAELGTQGLLGMELKVLDKEGDFYRIQTPDNYISWVDKGGITRMDQSEFESWQKAPKVIFTKNFGYVYADESFNQIVSDITLGGLLILRETNKNSFKVEYPDQRMGYIKKDEAIPYLNWLNKLETTAANVETVAKSMDGFPYLWGGTSSKGMDCSGFTKMVYLMNGFVIPRDASQQVNAGKVVDEELDFSDLQKGDLLFFGKKATKKKKQRVTHVGIWLGNDKMEFIHASGNVHLSSMDKNQPHYDEFNKNRYLGSRRYLGVIDKQILPLKSRVSIKP
ncbi:MAG: glycoside hydrolase [Flavobacteriaceae bacterium]|nr:glycoside hydrolase [Flavobacteriaceae bacterium]|tara:strand:+ start:108387 stop:109577 length:1191 start_codon:yes stop_codon:yes gene_type:complete